LRYKNARRWQASEELKESLDYPATERKFNSYLADFKNVSVEKVCLHQHQGVEFIYVWKGRLAPKVSSNTEFLDAGDSLYFDGAVAARLQPRRN
jgi:hypothetical protein